MPVLDRFKDMGTVVMGKIESGTICEGDGLLVMPNKVIFLPSLSMFVNIVLVVLVTLDFMNCDLQAHVKVVSVYCDENKVRRAGPGENVRVKLTGIEEEDILSGFVLSSIGKSLN